MGRGAVVFQSPLLILLSVSSSVSCRQLRKLVFSRHWEAQKEAKTNLSSQLLRKVKLSLVRQRLFQGQKKINPTQKQLFPRWTKLASNEKEM